MPSYVHHSFQFPCTWVRLNSAARELSITEVTDMAEMVKIWGPEKRRSLNSWYIVKWLGL